MLDHFLNAAYEKTTAVEERTRLVDTLRRFPEDELRKLASGETKLSYYSGDKEWLDKFKGTPLFEQAIAIEEEDLRADMERKQVRQQRQAMWREEDAQRDDICLKRKLLDLELAKTQAGQPAGEAFAGEETPSEEIAEHVQMQQKGEVPTPAPKTEVKVGSVDIDELAKRMKLAQGVAVPAVAQAAYRAGAADTTDDAIRAAIVAEATRQQAAMDQQRAAAEAHAQAAQEAVVAPPTADAEAPPEETDEEPPEGENKESSDLVADAAARMMENKALKERFAKQANIIQAGKGLYRAAKAGFGSKGVAGAASSGKQYMTSLARKKPGQALGLAAGGAGAAGLGAGYMAG